MDIVKVQRGQGKSNQAGSNDPIESYDQIIALDWSQKTMAIARLSRRQRTPTVIERPADVKELKAYLEHLRGRKILTIEETTTSHWLYVELLDSVDRLIICDPYRNRLLSEGAKNDPIDAGKLCLLLKAGLLKEVYHSLNRDYELRKVVSAYEDVVKAGTRLLNQRSAIDRAEGGRLTERIETDRLLRFVVEHIDCGIQWYHHTKDAYERLLEQLCRKDAQMKHQLALPGIGPIGAVKIKATIIDARRFSRSGKYLSYCGLVQHEKFSGGKSYGKRKPRYDRTLKAVYKTAALAALRGNNPMRDYYDKLRAKGIAEHNAHNAVARMIAKISYGMLKNHTAYQPSKYPEHCQQQH